MLGNNELKTKYEELIKRRNETQNELFNLIGEMALESHKNNPNFDEGVLPVVVIIPVRMV